MDNVYNEIKTNIADNKNALAHIGVARRSGRYPWGSGGDPYQHGSVDFLSRVEALKKQGWQETPENIFAAFGMKTGQYKEEKGKCDTERRMNNIKTAQSISGDLGLNPLTGKPKYSAIGAKMGVNESSVRGWLDPKAESKANQAREVADFIKKKVDEKGMIDIGPGVDAELGISSTKLNRAVSLLQDEGYLVVSGGVKQPTNPGQQTTQKVICPPGTPFKVNDKGKQVSSAIYDFENVHSLSDYTSHDDGKTFDKFVYPKSLDFKRMLVRYDNDKGKDGITGIEKDGIIELRRGVDDISLGSSRYSQVRILVDGTHYIKGMAVYSDNMPDGVDIVFNTNKPKGTPELGSKDNSVLKPIKKDDPDNPFGSNIKAGGQSYYIDSKGNKQLSLINKRADEGDWTEWKDALPSQFLSKQSYTLAKKQLKQAIDNSMEEYNKIMKLTNPTIKKHLLYKFADECDSAAVHLQAAALPGQKYHVIIPINTLKDNEVYAPQYNNGTKLALVRYPHGGTFEIPILTVNNKNALGKKVIPPDAVDAIGITKKVADRLSGADFDGDTVMSIPTHDPTGKVKISSTPELSGLKGFDAKYEYKAQVGEDGNYYNVTTGQKIIPMKNAKTGTDNTQTEMGKISNLITDMTLGGASDHEKAQAVRHSQVVIDAAKHTLDYKQSEMDNNIKTLRARYQRTVNPDGSIKIGGSSTIISRASSQQSVDKRQGTPKINKKGEKWYDPNIPEGNYIHKVSDKLIYEKKIVNKRTGEVTIKTETRTQKSTKMAEAYDANDLVSTAKHPMELVYADYANTMKNLARKSRLDYTDTTKIAYNRDAAKVYSKEVVSLKEKVTTSSLNKPKEREALRRANVEINAKIDAYKLANDGNKMKAADSKKISQQAITKYRDEVSSITRRNRNINITDNEWSAIQAGAVSETTLKKILANTDIAELRQRAMPKESSSLSTSQTTRVKTLSNQGYSLSEIAAKMGTSTSTINKYLKGDN